MKQTWCAAHVGLASTLACGRRAQASTVTPPKWSTEPKVGSSNLSGRVLVRVIFSRRFELTLTGGLPGDLRAVGAQPFVIRDEDRVLEVGLGDE
jgi:hypothetical protein